MTTMRTILLLLLFITAESCKIQQSEETQALIDLRKSLIHRFKTENVSVEKGVIETKEDGVLTNQKYYLTVEFFDRSILDNWSEKDIGNIGTLVPLQSLQPLDSVVVIIKRSRKDTLNQIVYSFPPDSLARLIR